MLKYIAALTSLFGISNNSISNQCISFTVAPGTGCAWMCNYCATTLNTNNYYFTTDVCQYQYGGCTGNPSPSIQYTCCSM